MFHFFRWISIDFHGFFSCWSIDIARWERNLHPSFGTPSVESFDTPPSLSFGTLNAAASHCLRLLSKSETSALDRGRLTLVLEQSLCLLLSQALLYIRDPRLPPQVIKFGTTRFPKKFIALKPNILERRRSSCSRGNWERNWVLSSKVWDDKPSEDCGLQPLQESAAKRQVKERKPASTMVSSDL